LTAKETVEKMGWEHGGVLASEIAKLYQEALASTENGKIFRYQNFRYKGLTRLFSCSTAPAVEHTYFNEGEEIL
jgi:hypothetical protein